MVAIHLLFWQVFCQHGGHSLAVSALPAWWRNTCCFSRCSARRWLNTSCFSWYSASQVAEHLLFQLVCRQAGGRTLAVSAGVLQAWLGVCGCIPHSFAGVGGGGMAHFLCRVGACHISYAWVAGWVGVMGHVKNLQKNSWRPDLGPYRSFGGIYRGNRRRISIRIQWTMSCTQFNIYLFEGVCVLPSS